MRAHGRRPQRQTWRAATAVALLPFLPALAAAQWKPHTVRQLNGRAGGIKQGAKFQILTESWNRVVAVPYIVYMPEKDRLLMLVSCDYRQATTVAPPGARRKMFTQTAPASLTPAWASA